MPDAPPPNVANSGKTFIVLMVSVALLAAGTAWWHQYRQGQRSLNLWGAAGSYRIRHASRVRLQQLVPRESVATEGVGTAPTRSLSGQDWLVHAEREVSTAPGFVHARQALIVDHQFAWEVVPPESPSFAWNYLLQFTDEAQQTTELAFDLEHGWAMDVAQPDRVVRLGPLLQSGLKTFFEEQFIDEGP